MTPSEPTESLDAAFLRFRRRGELDALERVFRDTAPDLRQLALHLTRDVDAADDVLQTTFLTAIDDARSFRPGSRVQPWLVGILNNRVREHRRRAARTAPGGDTAIDAIADHGDGPDRHAALRELFADARRGIESLAQPYREVVQLTVEGGLLAKEVAERLGRPAGTVRAQIARGMEMLRRSLPASSLALVALDVENLSASEAAVRLASIRERVLEHGARACAKLAAGGAAVGAWGTALLVALGLMLAAFAVDWLVLGATRATAADRPSSGSGAVVAAAPSGDDTAASDPSDARQLSRLQVADREAPGDADPDRAGPHLITRCIDAETGAPIAGVRVERVVLDGGPAGLAIERSEIATGGPDGVVAVPLAALPRQPSEVRDGQRVRVWRLEFDAGAPYANVALEVAGEREEPPQNGQQQTLGDLSFVAGVALSAHVTGVSTVAFGGADARRCLQLLPQTERATNSVRGAWVVQEAFPVVAPLDPTGRFALGTRIPAGRWLVGVHGAARVSPRDIDVAAHDDGRIVAVEVEDFVNPRHGPIRGVVVDALGRAVEDVVVLGRDPADPRRRACPATTTAADGSFEITRVRAGLDALALEVAVGGKTIAAPQTVGLTSPLAALVRIELPLQVDPLRLEVVDADGAAVRDYAVRVHARLADAPAAGEPVAIAIGGTPRPVDHAGPFANGLLEFDSLHLDAARDGRLEIVPWSTAARATFAPTVVEVGTLLQQRTLRIVLPRLVEGRVRVVDAHGDAIDGALVEWLRPVGAADDVASEPVAWSDAVMRRGAVVRVGREHTDARGGARKRVPETALTVTVRAPGRAVQVFPGVPFSSGQDAIELTLGRSEAQLTGRLTGDAFARWLVAAQLSDNEAGWPGYPWSAPSHPAVTATVVWTPAGVRSLGRADDVVAAPVAADGTFRITVPAGARGRLWLRQIGLVARTGSAAFAQDDLGELDPVANGAVADVARDVGALAFGLLSVQVRAQARDGIDPERASASYAGKWIYDLHVDGAANVFGIDPPGHVVQGRAQVLLQPSAIATLSVRRMRVEERGNGYGLFTTGVVDFAPRAADGSPVRVVPGEILDVEMPLRWGAIDAEVRTSDGEPLSGEMLELETNAGAKSWLNTDARGRLELPFVSPGRAVLRRYEWTATGERIERAAWAVDVVEGRTTPVEWVVR